MPKTSVETLRRKFLEGAFFDERAKDVGGFFGVSTAQAAEMIAKSQGKLNKMWGSKEDWRKMRNPDPGELTKFYDSKTFLLTRMMLDSRFGPGKEEMLRFLKSVKKGSRVVDYGCGAGQYSMYLAQRDCAVTVVEIDGIMTDWLRWWFARHEVDVKIKGVKSVDEVARLRKGHYDVLVAAALLEHVPNPGAFAQEILKCLKDGGRLFALLGAFPSRGHLKRSVRLMPHVKNQLEAYEDIEAKVVMVGKGVWK